MKYCKIDVRSKLSIVMCLSTMSVINSDILMLLFILVASVIISATMESNLKEIIFKLKKIIVFMFFIALIQSVFMKQGNAVLSIGKIILLTDYGISKSAEFILRISIIIVSASILTTSSSREIVQGLIQWRCPYEVAFMVSVAIRFLPIFTEEMKDMIIAIQLRGIDLYKIHLSQKIKVYKYIFMPVVINALLRAKELSAAMEMKGFRAFSTRTSFITLQLRHIDYVIMYISLLVTVVNIVICLI